MTDEEELKLDGRLFAMELAVQMLFTMMARRLPDGPDLVRHTLDSTLLALETMRAKGNARSMTLTDSAREALESLFADLRKLPEMQHPAPPGPAP